MVSLSSVDMTDHSWVTLESDIWQEMLNGDFRLGSAETEMDRPLFCIYNLYSSDSFKHQRKWLDYDLEQKSKIAYPQGPYILVKGDKQ